jgi:hypothetical protein
VPDRIAFACNIQEYLKMKTIGNRAFPATHDRKTKVSVSLMVLARCSKNDMSNNAHQ